MKLKYYITLFLLLIASSAFATNGGTTDKTSYYPFPPAINSSTYNTAFGVRGMGTSGLTVKHFTGASRAWEGIVGLGPDAFSLTLLVEYYTSAFDEPGLRWYYGIGGHIATQTQWVNHRNDLRGYQREPNDFGVGIDGIFGIEYKISEVPIAISLDVKPFLEVTTAGNAYLALDPGLGVKFTF